jgi:hypothetical protein
MDDHEQVDQAVDHQHGLGRLLWLCRRALLSPYAGIIGPIGLGQEVAIDVANPQQPHGFYWSTWARPSLWTVMPPL